MEGDVCALPCSGNFCYAIPICAATQRPISQGTPVNLSLWYHGTPNPFVGYQPDLVSDGLPGALFLSESPNVARRYGQTYQLAFNASALPRCSVDDYLNDRHIPSGSFVIESNGSYDFPVDTLVLREAPLTSFSPAPDLSQLDDGRALTHEPDGEHSREFSLYLKTFYDNDLRAYQRDQSCFAAG